MWTCDNCGRHMLDSDWHWHSLYTNDCCSEKCAEEFDARHGYINPFKATTHTEIEKTSGGNSSYKIISAYLTMPDDNPFSWSFGSNMRSITVKYGRIVNKGDAESAVIRIAAYGELHSPCRRPENCLGTYKIGDKLQPDCQFNAGSCTINLSKKVKVGENFDVVIEEDQWYGYSSYAFVGSDLRKGEWNKRNALEIHFPTTDVPKNNPFRPDTACGVKKGTSSKVTIYNASYSYVNGECTLKASRVQNDSPWGTGKLKLVFWFSTNGKYTGDTLQGFKMAEVEFNDDGLIKGYGYPNVNLKAKMTGNPAPGTYQPVITVNEKHESGKWYIVGWSNFQNSQTWKI